MAYFDKIPDILYLKYDKNPYDGNFIRIKNIFGRIKVIDEVLEGATVFQDYFVQDHERPDTIAYDFYKDPGLDWVIMIINNIRNIHSDWPRNTSTLTNYIERKYRNPGGIHHYETLEQRFNERVILQGGIEVGESFRFIDPRGNEKLAEESRGPVNNLVYETRENDKKKKIYILKEDLIEEFVDIFTKEMKFTTSTEFVSETLKRNIN
jgi:hypothetical protein